MMGGVAFDALSDLHYQSMVMRLDGYLVGRIRHAASTIDKISLGNGRHAAAHPRRLSKIPLQLQCHDQRAVPRADRNRQGYKDPRQAIAPVMPFPDRFPGIDVVVSDSEEEQEQHSNARSTTSPSPQTRTERE